MASDFRGFHRSLFCVRSLFYVSYYGGSFVRLGVEGCGHFGKVGCFQSLDFGIGKSLNAFKVGALG